MSEQGFEVVFRGDVVPGYQLADVKQQLTQLFNADAARIEQLFSGKPVTIKSNLDRATADRYKQSLEKAGALVDVRPVAAAESQPAATQDAPDDSGWSLSAVGDDVLNPDERRDLTPADVDTSHLSLAETGADVLRDEEKKEYVEKQVDTSHLSVDKPG